MPHPQYQRPADYELLTLAEALARVAHSGQTRSGGEPFFEHARRVAESVWEAEENYLAATIAYLHDTIEDTTITRATLRAIGFPREIVDAVTMLTSGEDEEYEHYIERLLQWGSDDALTVKLADLTDNLRSLDSSTFTEPKKARLKERWLDARMRVLAEQNRRDAVRQITDWQVDKLLGEAA